MEKKKKIFLKDFFEMAKYNSPLRGRRWAILTCSPTCEGVGCSVDRPELGRSVEGPEVLAGPIR